VRDTRLDEYELAGSVSMPPGFLRLCGFKAVRTPVSSRVCWFSHWPKLDIERKYNDNRRRTAGRNIRSFQPERAVEMSELPGASQGRPTSRLQLVQRLPTSGARSAAIRQRPGEVLLAVAQFATDVSGQPPSMHGGDSDVSAPLYRWVGGAFIECGSLALSGGEHIEFFDIGRRSFVAATSIRSGSGPYDMNARSWIREWIDGESVEVQCFDTFGAKQWKHFSIEGRHFLALAQGLEGPNISTSHPRTSRVFEWQADRFVPFQVFEGRWGYAWWPFNIGREVLLAYADHLERSLIYRWNGQQFEPMQTLEGGGGRAFASFSRDGADWLVFANIQRGVELLQWNGSGFDVHAKFGAPGARAVRLIKDAGNLYLLVANFIQGTPAAPRVLDRSELYAWEGTGFVLRETFPTSGAVDIASFDVNGVSYIVVANSLDHDLRFRADVTVFRFAG
jgi:EPTP domain